MRTRIVVAASGSALRATLEAALTEAGFEVTAGCESAQAAVTAVARDRPDVCIVDAGLAGGALVAAASIASPRTPPAVIVIDPDGTEAVGRAAEIAGAAECLRGQLDLDHLAEVVLALAKRRESSR